MIIIQLLIHSPPSILFVVFHESEIFCHVLFVYYWIALHHFGFQKYHFNYLMIKETMILLAIHYQHTAAIAMIIFQTTLIVNVIFSSVYNIKHVTKMLLRETSSVACKIETKRNSAFESIFLRGVTKMVSQVTQRDQSSIPFIVIINQHYIFIMFDEFLVHCIIKVSSLTAYYFSSYPFAPKK